MSKILISLFCINIFLGANTIDSSINIQKKTNLKLANYQTKINKLNNKYENLLVEYNYVNKEIKNNKAYNNQLRKIVLSQKKELLSFDNQIKTIGETQKNLVPLMLEMLESLNVLLKEDAPFLLDERKTRLDNIKKAYERSNITNAEKYRIILEAFKIEYDYANTIESYKDLKDNKTYDFLRIGRVGLYYQSLNLKEYGYWDKSNNKWVVIDDFTAQFNIRKAIKIAKKHNSVSFLNLPFSSTKELK